MISVRRATANDQEPLGRFGAALVRQHYAADPGRFIRIEHAEQGYGRFLVSQLSKPTSLVAVAERDRAVVGYVYADIEPTNWMELRGPCGVVQDVYVDEAARNLGAGRALMRAAIDWIRAQDRSLVVLRTKTGNQHAQRLFASLGFRPTMLEMTLDDGEGPAGDE